jgi:hypothetical protein
MPVGAIRASRVGDGVINSGKLAYNTLPARERWAHETKIVHPQHLLGTASLSVRF